MQLRVCSHCGARNYSSNTKDEWNCHTCNNIIKRTEDDKNVVKFKVNAEFTGNEKDSGLEYMAYKKDDNTVLVVWIEHGQEHFVDYKIADMQAFFKDGTWIRV